LMTRQMRASTDAVLMSRQLIARDAKLAQSFHRAYFEALRDQVENPPQSANAVAAWGNNAYTGVSLDNAIRDYETQMKGHAIASLAQNLTLMKDTAVLVSHMDAAREIARFGGAEVVAAAAKDQLDGRFVLALEGEQALRAKQLPIDPTFSLARDEDIKSSPGGGSAELPCRNFTFKPSSSELTEDSKKIIDICVLPALRMRVDAELKIVGSAAWPSGNNFDETQIKNFGLQRAQSISQYLASKGVDVKRLKVESVVPPQDRRDTSDESKLSQDRFVEMTVVAQGW
jgi:outer membrane protein OmpA-like peptidoglycan-associated protein